MKNRSWRVVHRAVCQGKSLEDFTDVEWGRYLDWAQWINKSIAANAPQQSIDALNVCLAIVDAESARRGM